MVDPSKLPHGSPTHTTDQFGRVRWPAMWNRETIKDRKGRSFTEKDPEPNNDLKPKETENERQES